MPLVVAVLGAGSLLLLVTMDSVRQRLLVPDEVLARAVGQIQTHLATAHLWVEEYVTGDEVDLGEISYREQRALDLLDAMLGGGSLDPALPIQALGDEPLRRRAEALRSQVASFNDLTERRLEGYEEGLDVAIGSPLDEEFDQAFYTLLADLQIFDDIVRNRVVASHRRSVWLLRGTVLAWAAIVVVAVLGLWSRERRRRRVEEQLEASRAQLLQAQKLDSIGQLAGGIAHDINNYLAAISAQCEVVGLSPRPEEKVRSRMTAVVETVGRASDLIKQLLAFSRRQPARSIVMDLNEVVRHLTPMFSRLLGGAIRLETDLSPDLAPVQADPSQIEQIIANLLINARDAMPAGGHVLVRTVPVRRPAPGGRAAVDWALLEVADDGTGVPSELRDRIFEPFVSSKTDGDHSGLGLATVYGIVKQNNGEIEVQSEPGEGATFAVYWPCAPAEARAALERPGAASQPLAATPRRGHRILLVEDNDEVRDSTLDGLRALGHEGTAAASGVEALRLLDEGLAPELVITDVVMPEMNGRQLAAALARLRPGLPVLYVSGHTRDVMDWGDEEPPLLTKPFTLAELDRAVRRSLGG
jgi:signal transduction histidine kinase/CheY-like chemotaxis protein